MRKKNRGTLLLILLFFLCGCSSSSATPAAKIVSGLVSNVVSNVVTPLFKWLWSQKLAPKAVVPSRSMMKFEGGYTVETVFDGSKLGIEPYSMDVSPAGDILILDSENSNVYKISTPLSRYSRPKLVAGSPEGYSGHVDGRPREAKMNHPKGLTVDDRGNIYIADTANMAIRKISDAGVVTIAGGKWGRAGGHIDGPSEDAKFSNDFDVVYVGSSCSLLVIDRGNQAIREIQLNDDDCHRHSDDDLHLGVAVLLASAFFGFMLALLQRRVASMFLPRREPRVPPRGMPPAPYQKPLKPVMPPYVSTEDEYERTEEGLFGSIGRLFLNTGSSVAQIFVGLLPGSRQKPLPPCTQVHHYPQDSWPMQESFVIPNEDAPPPLEPRDPALQKANSFMANDPDNARYYKRSRPFYGGRDVDYPPLQQQQQQQHRQKNYASGAHTYYEQNCETNEIVFGAIQEQDGQRGAMVIKAVDYEDPIHNNLNIRSRSYNCMGYSYGY